MKKLIKYFFETDRRKKLDTQYYIVCEYSSDMPMTWGGDQFYYSHYEGCRSKNPVELYTLKDANNLIEQSHQYRLSRNLPDTRYKLYPVFNPYINN